MSRLGHLMEAIERHLQNDGALTCAELCARTGYANTTVHDSLMRLQALGRIERRRNRDGWSRGGRGSPPFFYELLMPDYLTCPALPGLLECGCLVLVLAVDGKPVTENVERLARWVEAQEIPEDMEWLGLEIRRSSAVELWRERGAMIDLEVLRGVAVCLGGD